MTNIKEALAAISRSERQMLDYAFENGIADYVIISKKWFIGVNLVNNPNITVLETKGLWAFGEIK
jgi:hypothetical protein